MHRDEIFSTKTSRSSDSMSGKVMSGKVKILTLALGLALASATSALAQGNGAPAANKVGIVGIQQAIANSNEGKKELDALQARFAGKQNELKALQDEVSNLQKQLQAQGDKLSDEERNNRVKALESKQKILQRNGEDFQNEVQTAEQEMVNRLGAKMMAVLEKYAAANGYGVILDVSNPQTPVLWASQSTNITKELIDAYNAQSPVAPPAPKPAGSGAAAKPAGTATPPKQP
jgi:outer membrane protein